MTIPENHFPIRMGEQPIASHLAFETCIGPRTKCVCDQCLTGMVLLRGHDLRVSTTQGHVLPRQRVMPILNRPVGYTDDSMDSSLLSARPKLNGQFIQVALYRSHDRILRFERSEMAVIKTGELDGELPHGLQIGRNALLIDRYQYNIFEEIVIGEGGLQMMNRKIFHRGRRRRSYNSISKFLSLSSRVNLLMIRDGTSISIADFRDGKPGEAENLEGPGSYSDCFKADSRAYFVTAVSRDVLCMEGGTLRKAVNGPSAVGAEREYNRHSESARHFSDLSPLVLFNRQEEKTKVYDVKRDQLVAVIPSYKGYRGLSPLFIAGLPNIVELSEVSGQLVVYT